MILGFEVRRTDLDPGAEVRGSDLDPGVEVRGLTGTMGAMTMPGSGGGMLEGLWGRQGERWGPTRWA